jgi:uncharacterized protein YegL
MPLCLPTYVVIDASSSMKEHEAVLNATLARLHYNLATNPRVSEFARVCVVAFSTDVHVVVPMSDMEQVPAMPEVICGGRTEYGKTFDQVRECIQQDVSNLKAQHLEVLRPAVFFLTDGGPTDAHWQDSFRKLVDRNWSRHPHMIAYGFGAAKRDVLEKVATKALFIADGSDTESALSGAITALLNTLIASSAAGTMNIPTNVDGFTYVPVTQEFVD